MDESDINLRLLHISILGICKVFEPLICYLKGIWVHLHAVTLAKFAPDLRFVGHMWSENDAITSWMRLIFASDCFQNPHWIYAKCLRHLHAVSRAFVCTLMPLHQPRWPQIWELWVTCGVKLMP